MQTNYKGRLLLRRFEVRERLSTGQDIDVFTVDDRVSPGRERILKIASGRSPESARAARLEAEYRLLADIRHPSIVGVLEFGSDLGEARTWLLEEKAPGVTLDRLPPLALEDLASLVVDIARALSLLHARGLVHADLKPLNVFHDALSRRTTLVDFDLAGPPEAVLGRGTLPYAAPEMMGAQGVPGPASDLFSLGVILHELLTRAPIERLATPSNLDPGPEHPGWIRELVAALTAADPKARPQCAREIISALQAAGPRFPIESSATRRATLSFPPLIGREEEVRQILEVVPAGRRRRHETQFCIISGGAGLGKTRLVTALALEWRAAGARVLVIQPERGPSRTLEPVRFLLRSLHRMEGGAGDEDETARLRVNSGGDLRQGLFDRLVERLFALVRRRRTIIVFEDVHRYDEPSREFIVALLLRVSHETWEMRGRAPVEIMLTHRDAELEDDGLRSVLDAAERSGGARVVQLKPLGHESERRLLALLADGTVVTDRLVQRVHAMTGGVPLYLREYLLANPVNPHGSGPLLGRMGTDSMEPDGEVAVPESIEDLVSRRLGRLLVEERVVIEAIAAFPNGVELKVLGDVVGPSCDLLTRSFRLLELDLAVEQQGRFHVSDASTRAVVLGCMTPAAVVLLHARAAEVLVAHGGRDDEIALHEIRGPDPKVGMSRAFEVIPALLRLGADEEAVLLLEEIRHAPRASAFSHRAATLTLADLRSARGQWKGARSLLEEFQPDSSGRDAAVERRLALVDARQGNLAAARTRFESLASRDLVFSPRARMSFLLDSAEFLHAAGHSGDARAVLDRCRANLQGLLPSLDAPVDENLGLEALRAPRCPWPGPWTNEVARALALEGDLAREAKDFARGLRAFLSVVKLKGRLRDLAGVARAWHGAGAIFIAANQLGPAERYFRKALSLREASLDLLGTADTSNNLGVIMRRQQRSREAIEFFKASLRIRRQVGHAAGEAWSYINIANVHYERRELDAATRYLRRALPVVRRLSDTRSQAQILNNLGAIAQLRDRHREAIHRYREAERLDRVAGNHRGALVKRVNLAEASLRAGLAGQTSRALRGVAREARKVNDVSLLVRAKLIRARLFLHRGLLESALLKLDPLLNEALAVGDAETIAEVAVDLSEVLRLRSDLSRALSVLPAMTAALGQEAKARIAVARARIALLKGPVTAEQSLTEVLPAMRFADRHGLSGLHVLCASTLALLRAMIGDRGQAQAIFIDALRSFDAIQRRLPEGRILDAWIETPLVKGFVEDIETFGRGLDTESHDGRRGRAGELTRRLREVLFVTERALAASGDQKRAPDEIVRRVLEFSRALQSTAPLDVLLWEIVDAVVEFTRAERGYLVIVDAPQRFRIPVARDRHGERIQEPEQQISRRVLNDVLESGRSVLLQNAVSEGSYATVESVVNLDLRSILCAPLLRGTAVIGMLYVENRAKVGQFGPRDLDLLDVFATQAAIAIENSRLVREYARNERLRVLGNLSSGVAHDFNNLLSVIRGWGQALLEGTLDDRAAKGLRTIVKAADDGQVVVRRMQDFTRVRRETDFRHVSLREVTNDVLEFTRARWQGEQLRLGNRIVVVQDIRPDICVLGDPAELREVFTNLVLNSVSAMPKGGTLTLEATTTADRIVVAVGDTGAGMSEDVRESIFEPYFTTKKDGTGLGMSIVYGIVLRHHGSIRVESSPGEGTRVLVDLPIVDVDEIPAAPLAAAVAVPTPGGSVLIADDEPGIRELLDDMFSRRGYSVLLAEDGAQAIEIFERSPPDVVITDLGMRPKSGFDVARAVKGSANPVGVILLTGFGAELEADSPELRFIDRVFSKPFDLEQLVTAAAAEIRRHRSGASPSASATGMASEAEGS